MGGYEVTLHLTGLYPDWWVGHRFKQPTDGWAAGKNSQSTRDIIQAKLFGKVVRDAETGKRRFTGTGLIPLELIGEITWKPGSVADFADTVMVRHATGGWSVIGLKTYEQGRDSFEGTEKDWIWLDEEPPLAVHSEALVRTMTTRGLMILTFTPLEGMSEVVMDYLPGGKLPDSEAQIIESDNKVVLMATWDDAPHLSEEAKAEMLAALPPYQRDARSKGIPQLGSGAIYPVQESDIKFKLFEFPDYWPRGYALDVGWNRTAALWGAYDADTDTIYVYAQYYRAQAEPSVHADAIKAKGNWMHGVIDPAARGRAQRDGEQLLRDYIELGLQLSMANNAVEAGLYEVWQRLSSGRLKIAEHLDDFWMEYRMYRRDEKGQVVKKFDHLMDCLTGDQIVITRDGAKPIKDLAGTTGQVLGADGAWRDYYDCGIRRKNTAVIELEFSDGSKTRCTPDHLFLTPRGWEKANSLTDAYRYDSKTLCQLSASYLPSSKVTKGLLTTFAANTISAPAFAFTGLFGKIITVVQSLLASISTTLTWIEAITSQQTLLAYLGPNIWLTTTQGTSGQSRRKHWQSPLDGTKAQKAKHGTASMPKPFGWRPILGLIKNVTSAAKNIKLGNHSGVSVIQIVKRKHCAPEDVYCLSVPNGHAFLLANGLISHNCLRYFVMSAIPIMTINTALLHRKQPGLINHQPMVTSDYDPLKQDW